MLRWLERRRFYRKTRKGFAGVRKQEVGNKATGLDVSVSETNDNNHNIASSASTSPASCQQLPSNIEDVGLNSASRKSCLPMATKILLLPVMKVLNMDTD